MTQFIENIFSSIFGDNVVLASLLIAMVPIIELKGAIPFSMAKNIWGEKALGLTSAFLCGLIGSCLVVPILVLLYIPLIKALKKTKIFKSLATKIEQKVESKKAKVEEKIDKDVLDTPNDKSKKDRKKFVIKMLSVFAFVAIPLPFTGVYTGSCLAVALGLNFWVSCLTVILGNVVAGVIVTFISSLFESTMIFVYIFLGLILLFALVYLLKKLITNKKSNKTIQENIEIEKNNNN